MIAQIQRVGRALMLPIAVLPAAGLLLRLGQPDTLNIPLMANAGNAVFGSGDYIMAMLFAVGIAVGLAKENHGLAGLAGFISYQILNLGAQSINSSISLGVLGAIVAGLLSGSMFNQFSKLKTSKWLEYFGGSKGLAVLYTTLISVVLALVFGYVWPYVQDAFNTLGHWLGDTGAIGAGLYGFFNRLLIPVGLHHVLNTYIWFTYGNYHGVTGDLSRFFAGDPTAGGYMAGFFPIMMFGLPGAAVAMIAAAKPEKRAAVAGVMGSAAFTALLTGVTEPIEFAFMFVAPFLFLLHAIFTGVSLYVCYALGIRDGFNFSAGVIDYVLNRNHGAHILWLLPIGVAFFIIYFLVFYFSIKVFNLKTPGRENEGVESVASSFIYDEYQVISETTESSFDDRGGETDSTESNRATAYIDALGGAINIDELDCCTTRLRLKLKDTSKINDAKLKALGAAGVLRLNRTTAQVIVGTTVELLMDEMREYL
jgi:N-acetylglucosamine PTS system EIICBA or EIICB component